MATTSVLDYALGMPKAELHCHLEGTADTKLLEKLAQKNAIEFDIENAKRGMTNFSCLTDFISSYAHNTQVFKTPSDYFDCVINYVLIAVPQNIRHVEFQFELQSPLEAGMDIKELLNQLSLAKDHSLKEHGVSIALLLTFVKAFPQSTARQVIDLSVSHKHLIDGLGLAGDEKDYPISDYADLLEYGRKQLGPLQVSVHAGEEGPPKFIWDALEVSDRIDHGVTCVHDENLLEHLAKKGVHLTVCPLSNLCLKVHKDVKECPVKDFLDRGISVSVNSDDAAFFGSLSKCFESLVEHFDMTHDDMYRLAFNSIEKSFASDERKQLLNVELERFHEKATGSSPPTSATQTPATEESGSRTDS